MDNFNNYNYDDNAIERKIDLSAQMTRVFGWMFIGLLITGFTAMFTATSEAMLRMIFTGRFTFFILLILELVFVVFISRRRSEEHTSELQSQFHLVCRLLLEKKNVIGFVFGLYIKFDILSVLYDCCFLRFYVHIRSCYKNRFNFLRLFLVYGINWAYYCFCS